MALQVMRNNLKHLKWVVVVLIVAFVLMIVLSWGAGSAAQQDVSFKSAVSSDALVIGDHHVSQAVYRFYLNTYMQGVDQYLRGDDEDSRNFRRQMMETAPESTANKLIERAIMAAEAGRLGIHVSDQEVAELIRSQFTDEKKGFDKAFYVELVQNYGLTPALYEEQIRLDLLQARVESFLDRTALVPVEQVRQKYRADNEKAQIAYGIFRPDAVASSLPAPLEADLQAWYAAHPDEFKLPEARSGRIFKLSREHMRGTLAPTDEQLAKFFKAHPEYFRAPEDQRRASHILLKVDAAMQPAERKRREELIQTLKARAEAGEDFARLAQEYSEDGSARLGGDLDWFGRGAMVPEFDAACFDPSRKKGELVGPVTTQFGLHLIKITGLPGELPEYKDVVDQVRERYLLTDEGVQKDLDTRFAALKLELESANSVELLAALVPKGVKEIPFGGWRAGDPVPEVGMHEELAGYLENAEENAPGAPVDVYGDIARVVVATIEPARLPAFAEVRGQVEQKLRMERATEAIRVKAEALLSLGSDVAQFMEKAKELGGESYDNVDVTRNAPFGGLQLDADLNDAILSTEVGMVPSPLTVKEGVVAWLVKSRTAFDEAEFQKQRAQLLASARQTEGSQRRLRVIQDVRKSLEDSGELWRNESFLEGVKKAILDRL